MKMSPMMAPTLISAAYQLAELEKTLKLLDVDESLDAVENVLAGLITSLPVLGTAGKEPTKYFALVGGQWTPCYKGTEVTDENDPLFGGLQWEAIGPNGDKTRGHAKPREWAVALDGKPDWSCLSL